MLGKLWILLLGEIIVGEAVVGEVTVGEVNSLESCQLGKLLLGKQPNTTLKGVWVSIKSGYRDKKNLNRVI